MSKTEGARVPGDYELAYQPCTTYPDFQMREREISSLVEPTIIWVCNDRLTNILNSYACLWQRDFKMAHHNPYLLIVTLLGNPSTFSMGGICDLLLTSRIRKMNRLPDIIHEYYYPWRDCWRFWLSSLAIKVSRLLFLMKQVDVLWAVLWRGSDSRELKAAFGWQPARSQDPQSHRLKRATCCQWLCELGSGGTKALSPTTWKKLNLATDHVSLEVGPSHSSCQTPALASTLMRRPEVEDPAGPGPGFLTHRDWDKKSVLSWAYEIGVICYNRSLTYYRIHTWLPPLPWLPPHFLDLTICIQWPPY